MLIGWHKTITPLFNTWSHVPCMYRFYVRELASCSICFRISFSRSSSSRSAPSFTISYSWSSCWSSFSHWGISSPGKQRERGVRIKAFICPPSHSLQEIFWRSSYWGISLPRKQRERGVRMETVIYPPSVSLMEILLEILYLGISSPKNRERGGRERDKRGVVPRLSVRSLQDHLLA